MYVFIIFIADGAYKPRSIVARPLLFWMNY